MLGNIRLEKIGNVARYDKGFIILTAVFCTMHMVPAIKFTHIMKTIGISQAFSQCYEDVGTALKNAGPRVVYICQEATRASSTSECQHSKNGQIATGSR